MKPTTILKLCLCITLFAGISIAATWGMRAYTTHVLITQLSPTAEEKDKLDQLFDTQMSTASSGFIVAFFQGAALFYLRKVTRGMKAQV